MTLLSESHAEQQQPGTNVELATLILPSHAADRGLDQEDQVVLEATHETVQNVNDQSRISAIVDLTALSELVGCSEQEFIADLRMEAAATTELDQHSSMVHEDLERERRKIGDEEQPLLAGRRPSLLAPDSISLIADPFVLSLAEVLPVTIQPMESQKRDEAIVFAESTLTADGDQNLCHDAFLLNIPNENGGPLQDHFVLALPEIAGRTGSTHSETSQQQHMPFLERAMSLLPTTTHLPTDVVDLHLEAHQEPAVTEFITTEEEKEEEELAHPTLHLDLVVERKVPVIGYVILIAGLVALSSVGAALNLQQGPSPSMKTLWRQLATCLVLVPMVLKSLQQDGLPKLELQQWCMLYWQLEACVGAV